MLTVNPLNRKGKRMRNRRTGAFSARPTTKRAIVTVHADADLHDAFALLRANAVRRLPVVRDGQPVDVEREVARRIDDLRFAANPP